MVQDVQLPSWLTSLWFRAANPAYGVQREADKCCVCMLWGETEGEITGYTKQGALSQRRQKRQNLRDVLLWACLLLLMLQENRKCVLLWVFPLGVYALYAQWLNLYVLIFLCIVTGRYFLKYECCGWVVCLLDAKSLEVVAGGETLPPPHTPTHQIQRFFENIMYTLNLCSASLRRTKRRDASFVYDTQAGTWKNISLIWFGKERVMWGEVRMDAEREGVRKERDWSPSGWKWHRAPGYAFSTCGSRHLCSFSHSCLMLSQTSPGKQLQCFSLSLALCFSSTLSHILFFSFFVSPTDAKERFFPCEQVFLFF